MKMEVIEFYPKKSQKNKCFMGTMHIYVSDYDLDIRGIAVIKKNNTYIYILPGAKEFDAEQKKWINYSYISFTKPEKKKDIISFLKTEGSKYIEEKRKECC